MAEREQHTFRYKALPNGIEVWCRELDAQGEKQLKKKAPPQKGAKGSDRVLVLFPGMGVTHNRPQSIAGSIKLFEREILGGPSPNPLVDVFCISYEWPALETIIGTNTDKNFIEGGVRRFVKDYLIPMIDAGKIVTVAGYSAGGAAMEAAVRALRKHYGKRWWIPKERRMKELESLVFITIGNVSDEADLTQSARKGARPVEIEFASMEDETAMALRDNFEHIIPPDHVNGRMSMNRFPSSNGLLVMGHTIPGRGWKLIDDVVYERQELGHVLGGHDIALFSIKTPGSPPGFILALKNAVRNAVMRGSGVADPFVLASDWAQPVTDMPISSEIYHAADHEAFQGQPASIVQTPQASSEHSKLPPHIMHVLNGIKEELKRRIPDYTRHTHDAGYGSVLSHQHDGKAAKSREKDTNRL